MGHGHSDQGSGFRSLSVKRRFGNFLNSGDWLAMAVKSLLFKTRRISVTL